MLNAKWPIAWEFSFRHINWWLTAVCGGAMALLLALATGLWDGQIGPFAASRVVELLVPLFAGWQVAYLFSPEDERPLELMLAAPRPIIWAVLERLALLLLVYLALGGLATLLTLIVTPHATFGGLLLRWLPPLCWLVGLGLYLAVLTRQGTLGALVVLVLCGASAVGSGGLPPELRWIAPLLPYLQSGAANVSSEMYNLNRVTLTLGGLLLVGLALRRSQNTAHLLGIPESSQVGHTAAK